MQLFFFLLDATGIFDQNARDQGCSIARVLGWLWVGGWLDLGAGASLTHRSPLSSAPAAPESCSAPCQQAAICDDPSLLVCVQLIRPPPAPPPGPSGCRLIEGRPVLPNGPCRCASSATRINGPAPWLRSETGALTDTKRTSWLCVLLVTK